MEQIVFSFSFLWPFYHVWRRQEPGAQHCHCGGHFFVPEYLYRHWGGCWALQDADLCSGQLVINFAAANYDAKLAGSTSNGFYSANSFSIPGATGGISCTNPLFASDPFCILVKNAANNGNAAVAMFVIAMLMSLISAIFIVLRVKRINQNIASSGNGHSAPKGCHTRAAASVTLSVLSFVLMLVAAITVWVGVLPLSLYVFTSICGGSALSATYVDGAGAACAGVVIFTSFMAMVLDSSSHCCCKSKAGAGKGMGASQVIILPPSGMSPGQLMQQQQQMQLHVGGVSVSTDAHRTTVYSAGV